MLFEQMAARQYQADARLAGHGDVRDQANLFQHAGRQRVGFIGHEQHARTAGVGARQMIDQGQPHVTVGHIATGKVELEQDRLQQGARRIDARRAERDDVARVLELVPQHLADDRLARARGADQDAYPFGPLDAAHERASRGFDDARGVVLLDVGRGRERTFREVEERFVHRRVPWFLAPTVAGSAPLGAAVNREA